MWGGGVSMATAGLSVWGGRLSGETERKVQRVTDAVFVGHGCLLYICDRHRIHFLNHLREDLEVPPLEFQTLEYLNF
ncbi:hypothetical protein IRJ41_007063 [Triplophysa rosa]|uniref:Uncharacterized protein n=1 Tax=Triplophysa rosa TaxID=992332 RepID=A0A9W7WYQ0_TRIRA|nr:hypothetical protein IRJ41_007063 [Triplophysa rosa]